MMPENGILPRTHACLKLRDNPGNFRSRHSPLCEDILIAQIESPSDLGSYHASSALNSVARVFGRIQSLRKGFAFWKW